MKEGTTRLCTISDGAAGNAVHMRQSNSICKGTGQFKCCCRQVTSSRIVCGSQNNTIDSLSVVSGLIAGLVLIGVELPVANEVRKESRKGRWGDCTNIWIVEVV